jgi:hypothetical protein
LKVSTSSYSNKIVWPCPVAMHLRLQGRRHDVNTRLPDVPLLGCVQVIREPAAAGGAASQPAGNGEFLFLEHPKTTSRSCGVVTGTALLGRVTFTARLRSSHHYVIFSLLLEQSTRKVVQTLPVQYSDLSTVLHLCVTLKLCTKRDSSRAPEALEVANVARPDIATVMPACTAVRGDGVSAEGDPPKE